MNWNEGITSSYYLTGVDPASWLDREKTDIVSGSVDYEETGLRGSAALSTLEPVTGWVRIYLDALQVGLSHTPLFTGIATTPEVSIDGQRSEYSVTIYSVLYPAKAKLPLGYYVAKGADIPNAVKDLLSVTPAPVDVADVDHPLLTDHILAESGDSRLDMVDKLLKIADWRLIVNGDGTIELVPKNEDTVRTIGQEYDMLDLQATITDDVFEIPNCLRCISGSEAAEAKDEDTEDPLSIPSRGFEIWQQEDNVTLSNTESLAQYTERRLKELQTHAASISYTRRYDPEIRLGDLIELTYDKINGIYKVTESSYEIGGRVSEKAVKV